MIYKKILDARLKEKQPIEKSDIYNLVKIFWFKHKICNTSNKISRSTKIVKLQEFESNYFEGKSRFEDDGIEHYLVFSPVDRYFKRAVNINHI